MKTVPLCRVTDPKTGEVVGVITMVIYERAPWYIDYEEAE